MVKMGCEHHCFPECTEENNKKYLQCAKLAFLQSVDKNKPTFDTVDTKRICQKCEHKSRRSMSAATTEFAKIVGKNNWKKI